MKTQPQDYSVASLLIRWYERNGRQLPWRQTRDPYKIWISEIILQQTRVQQGMDYFLRFTERFPDVFSLAKAAPDEVMRLWQGLGYYSRARNLHAAAQQIAEMGGFPSNYADIRGLKGVGDYTAAAIASLAFDLPYAVVDGNVYRVLSRLFGIDSPIDTTRGKHEFAALAQELLPPDCPATYNQAIMDFGATVCTPQSPRCADCPLADRCVALAADKVEILPMKSKKTAVRDRYFTYYYMECDGKVALQQRTGRDIWQGLYQLPLVETSAPMSLAEAVGQPWLTVQPELVCQGIVHKLSHQTLHADGYWARCERRPDIAATWVSADELDDYAVPRLVELIMEKVKDKLV
ncbi:MAG: A/G-specific adenine glycosylase [Bacteroidaceae bacterium]|nr:A/G-specific adenine glycosylase [Bacteroidaceae bacterium]